MTTPKQLGAAAPMLALVLSFATVLTFGWWLGPSATGPGPSPDGGVAVAPTTADFGSAAADGPDGTDGSDGTDVSEVPDGSTASTPGRQVVTVDTDGDDEVVAVLPAGARFTQSDLRPTQTTGRDGRSVVCLPLPPGSTLHGKDRPQFCRSGVALADMHFRLENR